MDVNWAQDQNQKFRKPHSPKFNYNGRFRAFRDLERQNIFVLFENSFGGSPLLMELKSAEILSRPNSRRKLCMIMEDKFYSR